MKNKVKVPEGKWSDTRVMAWLAFMHGHNILEFIDEKVIIFSLKKIEIFHPDGWFRVNDLLVSNRHWENYYVRPINTKAMIDDTDADYAEYMGVTPYNRMCRVGNCKKFAAGNTWQCEEHQLSCIWVNCTKPRVLGSNHCSEHQPPCIHNLCNKPREIGEKYCLEHLILYPEAKSNPGKVEVTGTGGDPKPLSFLDNRKALAGGTDHDRAARPASTEMERVSEGRASEQGHAQPRILTDPILQEQSVWARGLNPKVIRFPHEAT
jgi:hypothetical protein